MNQIVLTVSTLEVLPLRYTPVGLPAVEMVLVHSSQVKEAGLTRQVDMTIAAIALGDMALLLADTPLGADMTVKGFLAPARKGSSKLVLHIQQAKRVFAGSATAVV